MSYEDGWAAMNMQTPKRVPRTEYSVESHWNLVSKVTGMPVTKDSDSAVQAAAQKKFRGPDCWNYGMVWGVNVGADKFMAACRTDMGHAVYASGGEDKRDTLICPFADETGVLAFDPVATYGITPHADLVRHFEDCYRNRCTANPDCVNMTGTYITMMSGLIDLCGWDMLLVAAGTDPEAFGALANRWQKWMQSFFDALADANVPVVMVHDDIVWSEGAFIHPDWYRKYIFPNYKKLFAPLIDSKKKILFTSDANYTDFIDDIAACGANGFVMEPMTDMKYIAEKYGKTHVFVGNADTRILLSGTKAQIRAEVERCMAIGKGCPGFFMAVGNHIPANTPVENALYYNEVYEALSVR